MKNPTLSALLQELLRRTLWIAVLLGAADVLLLFLTGQFTDLEFQFALLLSIGLSFGLYLGFICGLAVPFFLISRLIRRRNPIVIPLSIAHSLMIIPLLAGGPVALGILTGLVSFLMLEVRSKCARQPNRFLTSLVTLLLIILWRAGVGGVNC